MIKCKACGSFFTPKHKNNNKFCSKSCRDFAINELYNIKSGYPLEFYKNKESIMERDNYQCQLKDKGCSSKLMVHHIDKNKQNNSFDNLIVLCYKHHMQIHVEMKKNQRIIISYLRNRIQSNTKAD